MMKNIYYPILIGIVVGMLAGCCGPVKVQRGEAMDLDQAIISVLDALDSAQEQRKGANVHGLYAAEATVILGLTAGEKGTQSQSLKVVPTNIVKEIGEFSSGSTYEVSNQTQNTIQIKFTSVFSEKKDSYIGEVIRTKCAADTTDNIAECLRARADEMGGVYILTK